MSRQGLQKDHCGTIVQDDLGEELKTRAGGHAGYFRKLARGDEKGE